MRNYFVIPLLGILAVLDWPPRYQGGGLALLIEAITPRSPSRAAGEAPARGVAVFDPVTAPLRRDVRSA